MRMRFIMNDTILSFQIIDYVTKYPTNEEYIVDYLNDLSMISPKHRPNIKDPLYSIRWFKWVYWGINFSS